LCHGDYGAATFGIIGLQAARYILDTFSTVKDWPDTVAKVPADVRMRQDVLGQICPSDELQYEFLYTLTRKCAAVMEKYVKMLRKFTPK
jgi:hypothetical protein